MTRNTDSAHRWTDEEILRVEKIMRRTYSQAEKEMREKQRKALKLYAAEKEAREKALDGSKEAAEAHKAWLRGQALEQARTGGIVEDLARSAARANQKALEASFDCIPRIYAENANRAAFAVDKAVRADTGFTLVDENSVRLLMVNDDSPILNERVRFPKIDSRKDMAWNRQRFTSAITQGILQGESIPNIMKRVQDIYGSNFAAAARAVRTAATSAENAGRVSSYERAEGLGIQLVEEWVATVDSRTRESHIALDGEQVEVGEVFHAEGGDLRYPGDPQGPAEEVYNCRCTIRARVKGFEEERQAGRWSSLPSGMTYDDWKAGKA